MTQTPSGHLTNAAVCVLSFDGASDLWEPMFDALEANWPQRGVPTYLLTNFKQYSGPHDVKTLAIGEDVDWSSNLLLALEQIPEEHILFIFDDFIPREIDVARLEHFMGLAVKNRWGYLTLHPNNYLEERVSEGVRRISEHGVYRCTLLYGIFRKDLLIDLLEPGESAWDFEIESGIRARGKNLLSIERKVFRHYHLLRKGVWMRPGYPKLARKYALDDSRPVESFFGYLRRETKEWVFRTYHRTMPGKLIEQFEARRRTTSPNSEFESANSKTADERAKSVAQGE